MKSNMRLGIYSLKNTLFEGDAESVNCRTEVGEITVLNNHRPLVSVLIKGTVRVLDKSKKIHYIPISSGFLEVRSTNEAKLLVEEDVNE